MSTENRMKMIFSFCNQHASGKAKVLIESFQYYFERHGYLSDKQITTLQNILRAIFNQLEFLDTYEKHLSKFLKSPQTQLVLKLHNKSA